MFIFFFGYMYNSVYDQTSKLLVTKLFWRRPPFSRFVTCNETILERMSSPNLLHVVETNLVKTPLLQICYM